MNQERLYVLALIVVALLASIPQIPLDASLWGAILVIVGLVGGVMVNYEDMLQRIVIYIVAAVLPMIDNSLDYVPVVGEWLNSYFDYVAIGVQGMAIGLFVMALVSRAKS
jgi:hypothetical protein